MPKYINGKKWDVPPPPLPLQSLSQMLMAMVQVLQAVVLQVVVGLGARGFPGSRWGLRG